MSWIFDLTRKQKITLIVIILAVVGGIVGGLFLFGNLMAAKGQEEGETGGNGSDGKVLQKVILSGGEGVTLSQETFFNMGQEDGKAYILAPTGEEVRISVSLDQGYGIGTMRVYCGEKRLAFFFTEGVVSVNVPEGGCTVEVGSVASSEGGGAYGTPAEFGIDIYGLTDELLGLFRGKYNKAALIRALGTAFDVGNSASSKTVKSMTFTGQEVVNETKEDHICLLALINANEERRILVFFNTESGAFSFVTAIDEDRELVLRNVHKEEADRTATLMPTKKPTATITPTVAEETEPTPTAVPTEIPISTGAPLPTAVPTNTGAPLPTAVPTDTEKPETPTGTEKPTPTFKPTPTTVPGATGKPTPTAVPSARKDPSPTRKPEQNGKQGTKEVKADGKKKYQAITAVLPYAA